MAQFPRLLSVGLLVVVAVLCWKSHTAVGQRLLGCPISRLQIVSFNETLLPRTLNNITPQIRFTSGPNAATSFINYGPNHTDVWCAPHLETIQEPLVHLSFTEPVVIVGIISGGYTFENSDGVQEYVSLFTLHHTEALRAEDDQFTLYRANLTGNGETEFIIDEDNVDKLVILKESFSALRVRLQVLERSESTAVNITCWSMALFGCTASEALFDDLAPTTLPEVTLTMTRTVSTTIYVTPSPSCSPSVTTPNSNCVENAASQANQQVTSVVIPVALVTVITVVIVVVVGVVVCVKRGHGKFTSDVGSLPNTSATTEADYINTRTRGVGLANRNTDNIRERSVTIKEVKNELYNSTEKGRVDSVVYYEAIPNPAVDDNIRVENSNIHSSPDPATAATDPIDPPPYSLLTTPESPPPSARGARHQPVLPNSQPNDDDNYSMIENDMYSEPFTPRKEGMVTGGRDVSGFQLSKNESYGSLPSGPQPHYATPTSHLRYVPEQDPIFDSEDYEPMMLQHGTVIRDSR